MRRLLAALALAAAAALPPPALAADPISAEIAAKGIAATRDRLAALPAPGDAERFALAGLTFLGTVEEALRLRWRIQLSPQLSMLPVLRLPVPGNPAPEPFRPEMLRDLFAAVESGLAGASQSLQAIPEESDFGLTLRPADLWFDIDMDGARGPHEGFYDVTGALLFGPGGWDRTAMEAVEIRFDVADSRWLAAYAELVRGLSLAVLAYDPTEAIAGVLDTDARLVELNTGTEMANALDMMLGDWTDSAAVVLMALDQPPDRARAAASLAALEAVVRLNRDFWRLAAAETDDAAEWIPNDRQTSALGLRFPEGTAAAWEAVLADADRLLKGELLLPYWRLGAAVGLNLRRMFLDPRPVDLVGWVQGRSALPYAERGRRIDGLSLRRFDDLMGGRGLMFAVWFN